MHQLAIPTAAAMFALLGAAVALVLVWDGDAQRAKRAAARKAKAEREGREFLHKQVDAVMDYEADVVAYGVEHRRAEWHQVVDDLSIDVLPVGRR